MMIARKPGPRKGKGEGKGMIDDVRVAELSDDVHLLGEQVGRGVYCSLVLSEGGE
jgi:hypothetical protein